MCIRDRGMNLYSHGVDPKLNFHDMKHLRDTYERLTNMEVSMRQPYAGDLVFTAFSGSHQDAISKGMACHESGEDPYWTVPYLPIDPKDVGRTYDSDVIRINSQSGKGGVSYVLKQAYGINLPDRMKEEFGYIVKNVSDKEHSELTPERIYDIFKATYRDVDFAFHIPEYHFKQNNGIEAEVTISYKDDTSTVTSNGNGRLDSISKAIKKYFGFSYELTEYTEHSLSKGSSSRALAYVGITVHEKLHWGIGMDEDIIKASVNALIAAINRTDLLQ